MKAYQYCIIHDANMAGHVRHESWEGCQAGRMQAMQLRMLRTWKKEDKTGQKERRKKVLTRRLDSRLMADFPDMVFPCDGRRTNEKNCFCWMFYAHVSGKQY
jgi:hypothetical protein